MPIVLDNRPVLCAAPEYLEKFGESKTPQDLTEHNCLCLGHNDKYFSQWTFERSGKQASVSVSGNRRSKDGDVIRRWAIIGNGLALKSRLDVISDIKEGRLIEVKLDGWQVAPYPLYLICPERRLIDPLFNAVKEYLIDCVQHISV